MKEPPVIRGFSVLPDAHFECQGTGMCCRGYQVGPIDDALAERITAHDFGPTLAAHGGAFRVVDGVRVLNRVGGRCVFHADDGLCAIHRELGPDAKPVLCRIYPLNIAVDGEGVAHVSLNMECAGFAEGRNGPPLMDMLIEELDALKAAPILVVPERVTVAPGRVERSQAVAAGLEGDWLDDVEADRAPSALIADLGARLWTGDRLEPAVSGWPDLGDLARRVVDDALTRGANPVEAALHGELAGVAAAAQDPPELDAEIARTHLQNLVFGKGLYRAPSLAAGLGFERLKLWLASQHAGGRGPEASVSALRLVNRCLRPSTLVEMGSDFVDACAAASRTSRTR